MILGLGTDITEIARVRRVYDRFPERFPARVLSAAESGFVMGRGDPVPGIAGRFAAKEAAVKALGTGLGNGVSWQDVEILRSPGGPPRLVLRGRALEVAEGMGVTQMHVSISHGVDYAVAVVILEGKSI